MVFDSIEMARYIAASVLIDQLERLNRECMDGRRQSGDTKMAF